MSNTPADNERKYFVMVNGAPAGAFDTERSATTCLMAWREQGIAGDEATIVEGRSRAYFDRLARERRQKANK